jgi:ectoine hydroxylase-related dioxygenase (phytanoyl-CoA dioxygenase family)
MKTHLTPDQIESYRLNGFLVIEDFLSPEELMELKGAVLDAVARLGDSMVAGGQVNWTDNEGYYGKVFTQKLNLWKISETVKSYVAAPALGEMMCELEGVEGLRIWHDQALIKPAWGNPTSWHLDNPYWSFTSSHSLSIWIALEDATYENGCLYFLPGTHKESSGFNPGIGEDVGGLFKSNPKWKDRDAVAAPMRAGSASFHNGLTAHGAGANMTPRTRAAMTCAYMPVGSRFNGEPNILPPDYLASLSEGDELKNDEENPVVFHRASSAVVSS